MPGIELDLRNRLIQRAMPVKIGIDLLVADALRGCGIHPEAAFPKLQGLLYKPVFDHPVHTRINAFIQCLPVSAQHKIAVIKGRMRFPGLLFAVMAGDPASVQLIIFKRPYHTLQIMPVDHGCGLRIKRGKHGKQLFRSAFLFRKLPELVSVNVIGRFFFGKIDLVKQGLDIKSRASADDGNMAVCIDLPAGCICILLKHGRIELFVDIQNVDQVMRHALHLSGRDLGCPDVHAAVDLHAVGGNHLSPDFFCKSDRKAALSDGGRPGNEYQFSELFIQVKISPGHQETMRLNSFSRSVFDHLMIVGRPCGQA